MFQKLFKFIATGVIVISYQTVSLPLDGVDISPNYRFYNEAQYFAANGYLPLYVDNSFQPKANLNAFQVCLIAMWINNITPNESSHPSYFPEISAALRSYPFFQTAVEMKCLEAGATHYADPIETLRAADILGKFSPSMNLSEYGKDKELITREKFIAMLVKSPDILAKVTAYKNNVSKKEQQLIGSAVNEYLTGGAQSLDRLELSAYRKRNKQYETMFWEVAISRDIEFQKNNEDLSNEGIDVLTKRLNKALLAFYDFQFWQAIDECNLILKEDSKHVGALSLKGSSFYMLQNYEKAKKYWQQVLRYQPNNEEIKYFLEML